VIPVEISRRLKDYLRRKAFFILTSPFVVVGQLAC
jgi:hypothetical protein